MTAGSYSPHLQLPNRASPAAAAAAATAAMWDSLSAFLIIDRLRELVN